MTEPRPPIHPAPGDWPELNPVEEMVKIVDELVDENGRLRAELAAEQNMRRKARAAELCDRLNGTPCAEIRWQQERDELRAELAAANERAETAEQALREQPDWKQHWQHQVSRREEVEATLAGVMLERDSYHAQWQAALRELARKDAALIKCQIVIEQFMTELWEEGRVKCSGLFSVARETLDNINAALEPRKEGGE